MLVKGRAIFQADNDTDGDAPKDKWKNVLEHFASFIGTNSKSFNPHL